MLSIAFTIKNFFNGTLASVKGTLKEISSIESINLNIIKGSATIKAQTHLFKHTS